jgi:predicted ATPase
MSLVADIANELATLLAVTISDDAARQDVHVHIGRLIDANIREEQSKYPPDFQAVAQFGVFGTLVQDSNGRVWLLTTNGYEPIFKTRWHPS